MVRANNISNIQHFLDYIEEFSIKISDFNPISPITYISLLKTLPKCNNRIINI